MRRRAVGALVLTGLLVATPALAADVGVRVGNFYFDDSSAGDERVVVDVGDRIVFTFEGNNTHTATVDGLFDSGNRNGGETYTTPALMRPGTYTLFCSIHGAQQHGATLQVRGKAAPSPTRASSPSPSPVRTAAASPRPVATTAAPAPKPSPSASPKPSPSPSPKPSPSISVIAAPAVPTTAPPTTDDSPTPGPDAVALPRPAAADDDGTNWLLPAALVLLVLGLVATAIGLRRRGAA